MDLYLDDANAARLLLVSHSHSCGLLKEAALKVCIEHVDIVSKSDHWNEVMESAELLGELLFTSRKRSFLLNNTEQMSIAELRDLLLEKGQSVDGSRETLINRLKANGQIPETHP